MKFLFFTCLQFTLSLVYSSEFQFNVYDDVPALEPSPFYKIKVKKGKF